MQELPLVHVCEEHLSAFTDHILVLITFLCAKSIQINTGVLSATGNYVTVKS